MIQALITFIAGAFLIAYSFELPAPDSWFVAYAGIILHVSGIILLVMRFDFYNFLSRRNDGD
jgi:hypothetical protein